MSMKDDRVSADLAVIRRVMRRCGAGGSTRIRRLPGRSHRAYLCETDRGSMVVRLADPGRARFELETELLRRCAEEGIAKVAKVLHTGIEDAADGDGEHGVAVMVQERAPGEPLRQYAGRRGAEAAAAAVSRAGEALFAVHQLRTEGFGSLTRGLRGRADRLGDWFIDSLAGKAAAARAIDPDAGHVVDRAMELLAGHRPLLEAERPGLVHGDFSPDNVLVDDDGRITAIVDWEAAKSGPAELDIGWWDCFFDEPLTPTGRLVEGYERCAVFDRPKLTALRHLTVVRVMIGHFTWTLSVGDPGGVRTAADRLSRELEGSGSWRLDT